MKKSKWIVGLLIGGLLGAGDVCFAESQPPPPGRTPAPPPRRDRSFGFTDPNNYSRERLSRSTPTPKPTAKPQTVAGTTTGTAAQRERRPVGAKTGGAPANAPANAGQVKEVTKGMIEAIRTRKVEYNEEEMASQPGVVILNPRKIRPGAPAILRKEARQGEEFGVPAQPL
jgi:hypothetical protein